MMQLKPRRDGCLDRAEKPRVLIVEDDLIIALDLEDIVNAIGFEVAGLASSRDHAVQLAPAADIAFVDVNLSDGASGPEIGRQLAEEFGITVVFMTGNVEIVAAGITGTLGVVSKPVTPLAVEETLAYAVARRANQLAVAPSAMTVFAN
jgi:FixJ family two-component response regulator